MKQEFGDVGQKMTVGDVIALARQSSDPAAIDAALLAFSQDPPFYPDGKEFIDFFIQAKYDPALDAKLLAAAKVSAGARRSALLQNRVSDRQGAFTHFICPDHENPLNSKIFKVIRAPHIGGGTGAWGGLKEGEDMDVRVTVNREVFEEVIDAVKLLLKVEGGADSLEHSFDEFLKEAGAKNRSLSEGVKGFIATLENDPALQARVQDFSDQILASSLIDDLIAADKQKLFQCRDDAHAIDRGWGFKVDAFAHVAEIPKAAADKFEFLQRSIKTLQVAATAKGFSTVAGEMQGLAIYTLAEAPEQVKKIHYGHEGLAEIAGFARLLGQTGPAADDLWQRFSDSGAVDLLAEKMRLMPDQLHGVYAELLAADSKAGYVTIPAETYRAAFQPPAGVISRRLCEAPAGPPSVSL